MLPLLAAVALSWWTPARTEAHIERTGIAWSFADGAPTIDTVRDARCTGFGPTRHAHGRRTWNRFRCRIIPAPTAVKSRPYLAEVYLGREQDEILVVFVRSL